MKYKRKFSKDNFVACITAITKRVVWTLKEGVEMSRLNVSHQ